MNQAIKRLEELMFSASAKRVTTLDEIHDKELILGWLYVIIKNLLKRMEKHNDDIRDINILLDSTNFDDYSKENCDRIYQVLRQIKLQHSSERVEKY